MNPVSGAIAEFDRRRPRPHHWWLLTAPLAWIGLMEFTLRAPRIGIVFTLAAAVAIPALSWLWLHHHVPRWGLPLAVFVLLLSAVAAFSVVNIRWWQHVVVGISAVALYWLMRGDDVAAGQPQRGRITSFTMALAVFSLWLSELTFGVGLYVAVPWWLLAVIAAGSTAAIAFVTWATIDVPIGRFRRGLIWSALLGAELMVALWWLPTPAHVGAIVATTVIMLWLQAGRHMWLNDWRPDRGRRYVIIGGAVISLVLLTARWT
jgi:hypothetical protein